MNRSYDDVVLRPGKRPNSQSVWYYRGDDFIAVDAVNDALTYAFGKNALEARKVIPKQAVADPEANLKSLVS